MSVAVSSDASLAEELNSFFTCYKTKSSHCVPPTSWLHNPLKSQEYQVRRVLKAVNPNKAAGPDGELGKVLKARADQGS